MKTNKKGIFLTELSFAERSSIVGGKITNNTGRDNKITNNTGRDNKITNNTGRDN